MHTARPARGLVRRLLHGALSSEAFPTTSCLSPQSGPLSGSPPPLPPSLLSPSTPFTASAPLASLPPHLGPSVKLLLESSGLNPGSIPGTGPHGIITKGDVLAAIAAAAKGGAGNPGPSAVPTPVLPSPAANVAATTPPPPPPRPVPAPTPSTQSPLQGAAAPGVLNTGLGMPPSVDIPTSQLRRIIAQRLLESKLGSPHFYAEAEAIIDSTLALRKTLKEYGVAVSVNDFVVKAVALAVSTVPEVRVLWDSKKQELVESSSIDIAVAVATEKGLFTPIIKNANTKSLGAISEEVKDLAARARKGTLQPQEYQGGCFTISNLGMFPIDNFSAIINPPQPCILAVGRGDRVARWLKPPTSPEDIPAVVTKMEVTLSADARAVGPDGAGKFLAAFCAYLKDPLKLMA